MSSGYLVTDSSIDALIASLTQLLSAIEVSFQADYIIPGIMLLYSTIDTMSYLDAPVNMKYNNRKQFIEWTEKYLKPHMKHQDWTGIDIYAARCGLLHSLSSSSKLYNEGKASQVLYAWGDHKPEVLKKVLSEVGKNNIILHIDELSSALRAGVKDFFNHIIKNDKKLEIFIERTSSMLNGISIPKEVRDQIENEQS